MKCTIVLGATLMMVAATQVKADGLYLYGNLAAHIFSEQEEDGIEYSLEPGGSLGGGVGYEFGPFSMEALLEIGSADADEIDGSDAEGEFSWFAIVPNIYYNWHQFSNFTPRVGVGIGYIDIDTEDLENEEFFFLDSSEDYVLYQASAGVLFDVTDQVSLGPTYRFRLIDDFEFDEAVHILEGGVLVRF